MLELDHIVLACLDLDDGEARLRQRLGVPLAPGGRHVGWGTHNRLLQLGGGVYLELIAPDPSQPAPDGPRPFMLDEPQMRARVADGPRLVHWLVRSTDLEPDLAAMGYVPGVVTTMTRGALRWRITLPVAGRPPFGGVLPTVIQWDVPATEHPSARLPEAGARLERLSVRAQADVLARRPRIDSPVPIDWTEVATPDAAALSATLATPGGRIVLD